MSANVGQERAYAKINLSLDVLGKREDGYHELSMVMETVDLADTLTFKHEGAGLRVESQISFLPTDRTNLAVAAALAFQKATGRAVEPLIIEMDKRIPVCAGTAGGSSDAAATLRYLNQVTGANLSLQALQAIGETIGSDIPYCLMGGTALAEGRGERLTALPPLPKCAVVLCKPNFPISTGMLFGELDRCKIRRRPDTTGILAALEAGDLQGVARRLYNVFEDVLQPRQKRTVEGIKNTLVGEGALGAAMTGTGPTVFGLFDDETLAQNAYKTLAEDYPSTFLCHTL